MQSQKQKHDKKAINLISYTLNKNAGKEKPFRHQFCRDIYQKWYTKTGKQKVTRQNLGFRPCPGLIFYLCVVDRKHKPFVRIDCPHSKVTPSKVFPMSSRALSSASFSDSAATTPTAFVTGLGLYQYVISVAQQSFKQNRWYDKTLCLKAVPQPLYVRSE